MSEGITAVPVEEAPAVTEQPPESIQNAEEYAAPVLQQVQAHSAHKTTTVTHTVQHQHFQEEFIQEQATMIQAWPPLPRSVKVIGTENLEVTLSKEEGQSWGFRLGGGKEFGMPLCVIRVQIGSLAEKQGFQVGDVVNAINGIDCKEVSHNDALEAIKKAGNKCLISITRNIAAKGKVPRPFQTMAPLQDLTTIQPPGTPNSRPIVAPPVAAKATMRGVTLGQRQLDAQLAELTFTEEVIAETMTSHAEIVVGNALGVNFHKFEPQFNKLATSSVYQMLLEEEAKKGRTMTLPRGPRKPEIVPRKQPHQPPPPPEPPKEPTPPPKEPTPPPKEPTPPPKEPTPPPQEPTLPPDPTSDETKAPTPLPTEENHQEQAEQEPTLQLKETISPPPCAPEPTVQEENHIEQEAEQHENKSDLEPNLQLGPEPQYLEAEAPITNGVNGENKPAAYYQKHHELTRQQQELLQRQIKQKMNLEECRKKINQAQRVMYTPTPQPEEIVVEDCVTGLERKLPKAGARYRPSLPLTAAASLHQAFPTKAEAFEPFQARAPPIFQPTIPNSEKPLAKPACAVQCKIPMEWHPPSKLINGLPYKSQPSMHLKIGESLPDPESQPPLEPEEVKPTQRQVAHPLLPVTQPDLPKYADDGICLGYKHWN